MKIDIVMPCPACAHENNSYSKIWGHAGCGGILCIDEHGIVHCRTCGKKAHITKMYMSCSKHKLIKPSKRDIAAAISLGRMSRRINIISWLKTFLKHL